MALRLRRGTDGERLSVTPKAGELIYTTDTKKVFVGDGTTLGGTQVGALELNDLSDVDATGPSNGQGLVWSSSQNAFVLEDLAAVDVQGDITGSVFGDDSTLLVDGVNSLIVGNVNTSSVVATNIYGTLDGDVNGDVTGSLTGDVVGNVVGSVNGFVQGHVIGSVFATDSTLLVDGGRGEFQGDRAEFNNLLVNQSSTIVGNVDMTSSIVRIQDSTVGKLTLRRKDTGQSLVNNNSPYSQIGMGYIDSNGESGDRVMIEGSRKGLRFIVDRDGQVDEQTPNSSYLTWTEIGLHVGGKLPTKTLDVAGDAIIYGELTVEDIAISANNITTNVSNANVRIAPSGTGTLELDVPTQTTVGAAGGASALPASPDLYIKINVGGNEYVIPAFGVS